jgi:hypothetical protein
MALALALPPSCDGRLRMYRVVEWILIIFFKYFNNIVFKKKMYLTDLEKASGAR